MATTNKPTTAKVKKPVVKKATPKRQQHIGLVQNDSWLQPFEEAIRGRHDHAVWKLNQLTNKARGQWVFREWAPNATDIYLVGDFNNWEEDEKYRCKRIEGTGNWELKLPKKAMKHGDLFKMHVKWNGGEGERQQSHRNLAQREKQRTWLHDRTA